MSFHSCLVYSAQAPAVMQNAENASDLIPPMLGVAEEVKIVPSCLTFFLDTAFLGQCLHLQCSCDECV